MSLQLVTSHLRQNIVATLFGRNIDVIVALGINVIVALYVHRVGYVMIAWMRYLDVILRLLSRDASFELITSQLRPCNITTLFRRNIDVIVALGVPWVGSGNRLDWTGDQIILEWIGLW